MILSSPVERRLFVQKSNQCMNIVGQLLGSVRMYVSGWPINKINDEGIFYSLLTVDKG